MEAKSELRERLGLLFGGDPLWTERDECADHWAGFEDNFLPLPLLSQGPINGLYWWGLGRMNIRQVQNLPSSGPVILFFTKKEKILPTVSSRRRALLKINTSFVFFFPLSKQEYISWSEDEFIDSGSQRWSKLFSDGGAIWSLGSNQAAFPQDYSSRTFAVPPHCSISI